MLYYMISCTVDHMISHIMYHMSRRVHTITWLIFVHKIFSYSQFRTKIVYFFPAIFNQATKLDRCLLSEETRAAYNL